MPAGFRSTRQHSTIAVVMAFVVMCLLVGVLCFQYYRGLRHTITMESRGYLRELAIQVGGNAGRIVAEKFAVVGTVANALQTAEVSTFEDVQPVVRTQQLLWKFRAFLLIDFTGVAHDSTGNSVNLDGEDLMQAVNVRRQAMFSAQNIKGAACMVFVMPARNLTISGTPMAALAVAYEQNAFDAQLSINVFADQGYAYIVKRDGSVVIRSHSRYAPDSGPNLVGMLASAKLDDGISLEDIRREISAGKAGVTNYTQDGQHMYMAYVPLDSKEWSFLGFVPRSVVNASSERLLEGTLLLCAAITLGFSLLVAYLILTFSRHRQKLEQIAYVDPVTGGNTIGRFYERAERLLAQQGASSYALVYVNVEKFKLLNEEFGRNACDLLLRCLHRGISDHLAPNETLGRLFADNFCVFIHHDDKENLLKRFSTWYATAAACQNDKSCVWLAPNMEFGVYILDHEPLPVPHMIDRAKLALREPDATRQGRLRCSIYNEAIHQRLFRERYLESLMEKALEDGAFQVYLQPKYRADRETIGGAEALVRWVTEEGLILPDEFITLFEKNGFIVQLDLWVFSEVCRRIRAWLDAGLHPVKISVNCSRVHLKSPSFLERYVEICTRHKIPPHFIELELTENVVFEDVDTLGRLIDDIHRIGFGCSMDDFGSGHSSLNLIQDIPVDTIKLDKVFFRKGIKDLDRTESVVGSILAMSRSLNMVTVAEGVEDREQVDMLKRLGCDYIQGFFFSKALPVYEFEQLVFGKTLVHADVHLTERNGV